MTTHYHTCNLCEARCGIGIDIEGDRIIKIKGDPRDPFSSGYICPKGLSLQDIHKDKNRLRRPRIRVNDRWEDISWKEAFEIASDKISASQKIYGDNSVGIYLGNPIAHNYGALLFGKFFLDSLGTKNRFSAASMDGLPHILTAFLMFGHQMLIPVPDIDRTDLLLIIGANPLVSNGSIMTAPDIKKRLKDLKNRGGRLIVIDPRRTETAAIADRHYFIRPGHDAFFLLAMLQVLFENKLIKLGRLENKVDGLVMIRSLVKEFSPEKVESLTGISAVGIRNIAVEFSNAGKAVVYGRIGISTQEFGTLNNWLINSINILTGNFDREGGAMFTLPAVDLVKLSKVVKEAGSFGRFTSRVRKLPEFNGELPVICLGEEIVTPGKGQVKTLLVYAGNPVLSSPDGKKLEEALGQLDYMISIDCYMNETNRHSNLILPPLSPLKRDFYPLIPSLTAIRNNAKYSSAVLKREGEEYDDWEIFFEIMCRNEKKKSIPKRFYFSLKRMALKKMGPSGLIDLALKLGPYGLLSHKFGKALSLKKLKLSPHGIDLGPLIPCLLKRINTANRKIDLAPEKIIADLDRLVQRLKFPEQKENCLYLIGRRQMNTNNSWMHDLPTLKSKKYSLLINPADALAYCFFEAQWVKIISTIGSITAPVEITEKIMKGVVCLPHGWGQNEKESASFNDLTDTGYFDKISGTACLSGIPVRLEPVAK